VVEYFYTSIALIDINVHTSTSLTETEVDLNIFPDATELLQTYDGGVDVSCDLIFLRNGPIGSFSAGFDGSIDSDEEQDLVWAQTGRAKVVNRVNWCNGPPPGDARGCSGGVSIVVERAPSSIEGVLWAHEYGHHWGLWLPISGGHEDDSNRLGYEDIVSTARQVTLSECNIMRN